MDYLQLSIKQITLSHRKIEFDRVYKKNKKKDHDYRNYFLRFKEKNSMVHENWIAENHQFYLK